MRRGVEDHLIEAVEAGDSCAFGIIVATRGSAPQRPGARALFFPDGRVEGTLGGGCLEAEARRRALACLREGTPQLFDLALDGDFGWDDGLLCGGTVRVFVRPAAPDMAAVLRRVQALECRRTPVAIASIIAASRADLVGRIVAAGADGVIAGGAPPGALRSLTEAAANAIRREEPSLDRMEIEDGWIEVFIDPHVPHPALVIAGAGHVGEALARIATPLGFDVTVIDDRAEFANRSRFPDARAVIAGDIEETIAQHPVDADTYIVIVTRGHRHDAAALRACLACPARYIGMIGSRRKIEVLFRGFRDEGLGTAEALARVHAPIGLDIGAVTVEEIATSIAAELVAVRRKGSADGVRPMRASRGTPA